MKQVIQNFRTGELRVEEVPPPALINGAVLVRNAFSLISTGTEKSTIDVGQSSLIGKARKRPDQVKQVLGNIKNEGIAKTYKKVLNRLNVPKALGYSSAGVVEEVAQGVDEFQAGDRVACAGGGYACHAEAIIVPKNLCVSIPNVVGFEEAAFTTLGAIAMQGVRQAKATVGENIVVIGLGLLGLITVQILKAAGCNVFGTDIDHNNVVLAKELGADTAINRTELDVEQAVRTFSKGYGADAVIITAGTASNDPIELAGRISRDRGRIIVVGAVKTDIPRSPFYEKELELRFSRSYGPGRYDNVYEEKGVDYPIGYVRWTEKRNMESFLQLMAQEQVNVRKLVTHKFRIEDAAKAYTMITGRNSERHVGILLDYSHLKEQELTRKILMPIRVESKNSPNSSINVGFIGAGNFAQSYLLPHLTGMKKVNLKAVATAKGPNSKNVARRFGFEFCTTGSTDVLENPDINCIFIATRHNLHGKFVAGAIKKGKNVFVEKPLAVNEEELHEIVKAYEKKPVSLMVGFNRRFAPITQEAKKFFGSRAGPMVVNYRVNAGFLPKNHWIQDAEEGAGRITGEVCHFIDLIQYLTESRPIKVYAETISSSNQELNNADNLCITLRLLDGSLGVINYLANGDSSLPKERIEIFADNSIAIVDNFKKLEIFAKGKHHKAKKFNSKGHKEEIMLFINSCMNGEPAPIKFEDLVVTTHTTFEIQKSMRTGRPVNINLAP